VLVAAALGALALTGSAFGQSAHSSAATGVTTKKTSLGTILVTSSGQTLYLDSADKPGHPACTAGCLSAWPPLKMSGTPKASGSAKASLLGTAKIAGGVKQVTYNGHQLYTFASDTKSKPTSGEGVNGFYVVSPSGSKITKATNTTTTTTSSSSSGRYGY
jgi:predicted lipoprotein with Yx(FWY)xxD motif